MATKTKAVETNHKATNRIAGIPQAIGKPEIIVFRLIGTSPLLQNNPTEFIGKTEETTLSKKKVYVDEEEARLRCYRNDEGAFCHPSAGVIRGAKQAVTGLKFGKVSAKSALGWIFETEILSPLEDSDGNPLTEYVINRAPVNVGSGMNKSKVLRCRPMWNDWCLRVAIEVNTAFVGQDNVLQALALAGQRIGLGDFRPEKGGRFGRFLVEIVS